MEKMQTEPIPELERQETDVAENLEPREEEILSPNDQEYFSLMMDNIEIETEEDLERISSLFDSLNDWVV